MIEAKLDDLYAKARGLMSKKNHDYTNGQQEEGDCFANFRLVETMGLTDMQKGIMVRLCDKFARMATLVTREAQVADEKLEDTALDIINYVAILVAAAERKEAETKAIINIAMETPVTPAWGGV